MQVNEHRDTLCDMKAKYLTYLASDWRKFNEEVQSNADGGIIAGSFYWRRTFARGAGERPETGHAFGEFSFDTRRHERIRNNGTDRISAAVCSPFRWSL